MITTTIDAPIAKIDRENKLLEDWRDEIRRVAAAVDKNIHHGGIFFSHYTSHDLDHSCRVIDNLSQMTASLTTPLNKSEIYILCQSAIVHDIGMQCGIQQVLEKYGITLKNTSWEEVEKLRPAHERLSVEMIKGYFNEPQAFVDLGMTSRLADEIMQVAQAHRGNHWQKLLKTVLVEKGEQVRLQFLGALLNCADEFDKSADRVNIEHLKRMNLTASSKAHWFSHYLVRTIDIDRNGGITIAYKIPVDYEEITSLLVDAIERKLRDKVEELENVLCEEGVHLFFRKPQIRPDPIAIRKELGEDQLPRLMKELIPLLTPQPPAPPQPPNEQVSMYVDLEGIKLELRKRGVPKEKTTAFQIAPSLVEYARQLGNPITRCLYGRWARNPEAQDYRKQGFELIERSATTCESQVTADLKERLTTDKANTIIIFTGRDLYSEALALAMQSGKRVVFVPVDSEQTKVSCTAASQTRNFCSVLHLENVAFSPQPWNAKLQTWAICLTNFRLEQGLRWLAFSKLHDLVLTQGGVNTNPQEEINTLIGEELLRRQTLEKGGSIFVLNEEHPVVVATQNAQRAFIRALLKLCARSQEAVTWDSLSRELSNYRLDNSGLDTQGWLEVLANERIVQRHGDRFDLNLNHPLVALEQVGQALATITALVTREEDRAHQARAENHATLTREKLNSLLSQTFVGHEAEVMLVRAEGLAMFRQETNPTLNTPLKLNHFSGVVQRCEQIMTTLIKLLASALRQQRKSPHAPPSLDQKAIFEALRGHSLFGRSEDEYRTWIRMLLDVGILRKVEANSFTLDRISALVAQTLHTEALVMALIHQHEAGQEWVLEQQLAQSIRAANVAVFAAIHAGRHCGLIYAAKRQKGEPVRLQLNQHHPVAQQTLTVWRLVSDAAAEFLRDPLHTSATFWQLHRALNFLPTDWDRQFWIDELANRDVISRQEQKINADTKTIFTLPTKASARPEPNLIPLRLRKAA